MITIYVKRIRSYMHGFLRYRNNKVMLCYFVTPSRAVRGSSARNFYQSCRADLQVKFKAVMQAEYKLNIFNMAADVEFGEKVYKSFISSVFHEHRKS